MLILPSRLRRTPHVLPNGSKGGFVGPPDTMNASRQWRPERTAARRLAPMMPHHENLAARSRSQKSRRIRSRDPSLGGTVGLAWTPSQALTSSLKEPGRAQDFNRSSFALTVGVRDLKFIQALLNGLGMCVQIRNAFLLPPDPSRHWRVTPSAADDVLSACSG